MKKVILLLMLIPLISMVILAILSVMVYSNETSNSYANYESLEKANVFQKGLLPSFIPKSATMIELTHNKKTQHIFSSFYVLGDDYQTLRNNCQVLQEERTKLMFYCQNGNKEFRIRVNKKGKARVEGKPIANNKQ